MEKKQGYYERDKDREIICQRWPELSLAEKGKYIVSYYGIVIAVVIIVIVMVVFLVRDICKDEPRDAFSVMALDMELTEEVLKNLEQGLAEGLGLDTRIYRCRIEAGHSSGRNMQNEATVSACMRSGRVDLLIAPEEEFNRYASTGYLSPLMECGLDELYEECRTEELFYAEAVNYSEARAVRDVPFRPHEISEDSKCYGVYLQDEVFGGYVAGVMVNCPNRKHIRAGMEYFLNNGNIGRREP